jgi:hypothetical protein
VFIDGALDAAPLVSGRVVEVGFEAAGNVEGGSSRRRKKSFSASA